jgi:phenylalanyl-tRNA synthetase alpha chain
MIQKLDELFNEFESSLSSILNTADVLNHKANFLGKKGKLSEILKSLKSATPEQRKEIGPKANSLKVEMTEQINKKLQQIEMKEINEKLASNKIDVTFRNSMKDRGLVKAGFHPVSIIQQEIEDIFLSMGFEVLDGPHIEDEFHNFEALNIPGDHPARDMQDTFWFHDPHGDEEKKRLLRTHTSTIQHRGMRERTPPFKFIAPGKVFRCERTDASHEMVFHQLEGMLVSENISVANLIYFMKTLLSQVFKKEVHVRLRPGFFPF